MQTLNRKADDFVGNESFYEAIDFPTEEELLAALDASLAQAPWLPRPVPVALGATSRNLAQHWREITEINEDLRYTDKDDHYLGSWAAESPSETEISVEPDFMLDFAKFLMERLAKRMGEMRQAQYLLSAEIAKFRL